MTPSFAYENPLRHKLSDQYFSEIPTQPGVYFMYGMDGSLLYIGKAKSLKARLTTYRQAKPGTTPERTLELLEQIETIRWKVFRRESEALAREAELIQAIRPPFNIAGAYAENYLFIGYRMLEKNPRTPSLRLPLQFLLSSHTSLGPDANLFGCYKHRRKTKMGYTALLRLFHAAQTRKPRFSYPSRISRTSPPYTYPMEIPRAWAGNLAAFLSGKSSDLLHQLVTSLLENENIPRFMYPSLQDDIEAVRTFYRQGPRATHRLRRENGLKGKLISARQMDDLIAATLEEPAEPIAS